MPRVPIRFAGAAAALAIFAAGCGDSDDSASADIEAFCDAYFGVDAAFNDAPEGDDPAAFKAYFDESIDPLVTESVDLAPDDVTDQITLMAGAVREFSEDGDFSVLETEQFTAAETVVDGRAFSDCDGAKAEVTGVEYAFESDDLGDLEAGFNMLRFTNGGKELHEIVVFRKAEGENDDVATLLEAEDEDALQDVSGGFALQGGSTVLGLDLEAGDYALVCFVSKGSVDPTEEVDGPPHFTQGMLREFSVG